MMTSKYHIISPSGEYDDGGAIVHWDHPKYPGKWSINIIMPYAIPSDPPAMELTAAKVDGIDGSAGYEILLEHFSLDRSKYPPEKLFSLSPDELSKVREDSSEKEDVYTNKVDSDDLSIILVDINKELKSYLARNPHRLYNLSPRNFEELVADILKDFGFDVSLTPTTRDGGKDILAYMRNQICSYLMFVECKKWKPDKHVGIEVVQRLHGVQQANNANKSMIITTSYFSNPAIEESKRYEYLMALKDYNDLVLWLKSYI